MTRIVGLVFASTRGEFEVYGHRGCQPHILLPHSAIATSLCQLLWKGIGGGGRGGGI